MAQNLRLHAPGYYLSSPAALVTFPRPPRWDSQDDRLLFTIEEADIVNETIRGVRYVNKMFSRRIPSLTFRVPSEELIEFRDFHNVVGGLLRSFYFVVDVGASPWTVLFCKKEQDFRPKNLGPYQWNGTMQNIWDYVLTLTEEVAEAQILA